MQMFNSSVEPTFCVFRRGLSWLALPALAVQEVLPCPGMVFVPGTPAAFVGMCHVRSEFIPVLNLDSVLATKSHSSDQIMLILDDVDGAWGILVDEVSSLQQLEVSDAPETSACDSESVVIGWATSGDRVIQVLEQPRIRRAAEQELLAHWQTSVCSMSRDAVGSINDKVSAAAVGGTL